MFINVIIMEMPISKNRYTDIKEKLI